MHRSINTMSVFRKFRLTLCLLVALGGFLASSLAVAADMGMDARSSDPKAEEVVGQMIEAHGGYERWAAAPTVSFDNVFFNPFALQTEGQNPWWVSHEVVEQGSRRAYHTWPTEGATLAYDGEQVWSENWPIPNPPKFMTHFFYYFVNLPWLTRDEGVRLGEVGTGKLPGLEKDYLTVPMTFETVPGVGKTAQDSFRLFIDPDTHVLQGYEYSIGYGAMLDMFRVPAGQVMGPILRIHDRFTTADGLLVPTRFHTMAPDGSATYGYHVLINTSFSKPFDESRMKRPEGAVVDTSSPERSGS